MGLRTWRPYGQQITDNGQWGWLTYSADGRALRVFFEDDGVVEISIDLTAGWMRCAVPRAATLTPEESAVILPDQPVRPTCPDPA